MQFLAASNGGMAQLTYDLLFGGVSIASGTTGTLDNYTDPAHTYGFSGAIFDEVWLKSSAQAGSGQSANDRLVLDNIAIGNEANVPEPATWASMLLGFGMIGGALRARTSRRLTIKPREAASGR